MRKATGVAIIGLIGATLIAPPAGAWDAPRDPVAVRETFNEISARLDPGGDLFIVANMEGILENLVNTLVELAELAPASPDDDGPQPAELARKVAAFLGKNGFYAVEGMGFSIVPREDGLNEVKTFIKRGTEAAVLPLWRAMVGVGPAPMQSLAYLPGDTVLARSGTGDIRYLWQMITSAVQEIGGAEAEEGFNAWQEMVTQLVGTSPEALVNSIAPEAVFSLQLSTTETSELPMDGMATLTIPQPTMLMVVAVREHTIVETLKQALAQQLQMPLPEMQVKDATVYTLPIPIPSPIPVAITLATHGNYLLLGSTADVVTEALAVFASGEGLLAQTEFSAAFPEGLEPNNGIIYMSRRLGETFAGVQASMLEQMTDELGSDAGMGVVMQRIFGADKASASAFTIMNYRSGIRISGTSTSGGRELVAAVTAAPLGLMAAIAIPSFVRARTTSQHHSCINNLRMLDSAKEQWAMAENKNEGDMPDEAGVLEYLWGGGMPVCLQGGTYSLNPIGESPTCSFPGHELPTW